MKTHTIISSEYFLRKKKNPFKHSLSELIQNHAKDGHYSLIHNSKELNGFEIIKKLTIFMFFDLDKIHLSTLLSEQLKMVNRFSLKMLENNLIQ